MKYCIIHKQNEESIQIKQHLMEKIRLQYDEENPDYIVSIGGDGTILGIIQKYIKINPNLIIFGVHTGHLGFFTNYTKENLDILIDNINVGSFRLEKANLLSFRVDGGEEKYALNEVSILSSNRTLILDVYIDEEKLETYRGTGLCISTAHGSTAYNKSLHGSVVDTSLEILQLTEIAGINSNAFRTLTSPLILNASRIIHLYISAQSHISVTYDNQVMEIENIKNIDCYYSGKYVSFASNEKNDFVKRIRRTFV